MKKIYLQFVLVLGIYLTAAAQEWQWQNPFPVGNGHADVAWIDDQTFYVSGSKGQFIKTNDFGQSWEVAHIPTDAGIEEIHFNNASKGWAATDNGEIWTTEDAGSNWTLQAENPESPTLRDIHFSGDVGYAVGDAGYAENAMMKTNNGGLSWEQVTTLPVNPTAAWYGMFFTKAINKDTVYAASWDNTFFKSYDQGVTWDTTHLPMSAGGFYEGGYFVNDSIGFVVGPNGSIAKTVDYGDSWELLSGSADSTDQDSHYFSEVFFLDNQMGWVSSFGCLNKTTDGGTSWNRTCEGTYGTGRKSFISFNEENKGIAVAGANIYVTQNGSDFDLVLPTDPVNNLYSISETSGHLYAAASEGKIFHSSDKGQNWMVMNTSTSSTLNDVQFVNQNHAWAVGNDSTIIRTTDTGVNWDSFDLDYYGNFNDLYAWSSSNAIVVGSSGGIFKTTNEGASWTKGTIASENRINAVHFPNADTGYVVGQSGLLARTTDGGANWTIQDPGILSHLNDIFFLNGKTGYAVGSSGKILFTGDAGATWTEQVSGQAGTLNAVFFSYSEHGYVTTSGKVLVTEDGGQNWMVQSTPSGVGLLDIYFDEEGNGWAVGGNGNIIFYEKTETGLNNLFSANEKEEVSLFPNPVRTNTTFALTDNYNGTAQLFIYSSTGNLISNSSIMFQGGQAEWSVKPYISAGVYSFQIIIPGETKSGKLIIQK